MSARKDSGDGVLEERADAADPAPSLELRSVLHMLSREAGLELGKSHAQSRSNVQYLDTLRTKTKEYELCLFEHKAC